eukprot:Hpha_TRINITY_DN10318_c0_g1::TRINITY_DN10318_c0_g1_i2::g.116152::m.116152
MPSEASRRGGSGTAAVNQTEVLLVSGTGKRGNLDSTAALSRLKREREMTQSAATPAKRPRLGVAFNPYFATPTERAEERSRLVQKLMTGEVSKVYLQFGSDLGLLRDALDWLSVQREELRHVLPSHDMQVCGSLFLPTNKLIAQQRFRPWNGVFLCERFLSGEEGARGIVVQMLRLYEQFGVEVLVEAPGVRTEKDLAFLGELLRDASGPGARRANHEHDGQQQAAPSIQAGRRRTKIQ